MIPAAVLLACPNLAVPTRLMYHVAMVESGANPYAIGVVGGRLLRQPASLDEAIATARSLEAQGYNFSVGVAQVNHGNLKKYGLDTYEKAFSICDNLLAGSRILAQCYADAGGVWGRAFSCYYSGDFTTGFRDGYVQRVLTSLGQGGSVEYAAAASGATPIRVVPAAVDATKRVHGAPVLPRSAAYRVTIRTSLMDAAANAVVTQIASKVARIDPQNALPVGMPAAPISTSSAQGEVTRGTPGVRTAIPVASAVATAADAPSASAAIAVPAPKIFVPQVVDLKHPAPRQGASERQVTSTSQASPAPPEDSSDAAFVF